MVHTYQAQALQMLASEGSLGVPRLQVIGFFRMLWLPQSSAPAPLKPLRCHQVFCGTSVSLDVRDSISAQSWLGSLVLCLHVRIACVPKARHWLRRPSRRTCAHGLFLEMSDSLAPQEGPCFLYDI